MWSRLIRIVTQLLVAFGVAGVGFSGAGVSRHASVDPSGLIEVVLCAEAGAPQSVWLDADGRPADPDQSCDTAPCAFCTAPAVGALPVAPVAMARFTVMTVRAVPYITLRLHPLRWRAPLPHGPPVKSTA